MLHFYGKELLAPHQILQAEGPPPVGRRDSLFNIFALHSITEGYLLYPQREEVTAEVTG
jgi:hypothetical protein